MIDIKAYDPTYGETWMFFPDGNGNPQVIDLPTVTGYMKAGGHDNPDSKIFIFLYNQWVEMIQRSAAQNTVKSFKLIFPRSSHFYQWEQISSETES